MILVYTSDIIGSRNYGTGDRQNINRLIDTAFQESCRLFPELQADYLSFAITQGDEFQFLADKMTDYYKFLLYFRTKVTLSNLKPLVFFRTGIGFGERATTGNNSYEMDGSAFYNARSALDGLKAKHNLNRFTRIEHPDSKINIMLNSILMFCDELEYKWTPSQRQAIHLMLQGHNVTSAAESLSTSWQNVSKTLASAKWDYLEHTLKIMNEIINP
jgi:hypothetical protein